MDSKKLEEVFDFYINYLESQDYKPVRLKNRTDSRPQKRKALNHLCWMCYEAKELVGEERLDKAFRWLGFIQGWLTAYGVFSINDVKHHSKPKESG